jgi:hypothetical protein
MIEKNLGYNTLSATRNSPWAIKYCRLGHNVTCPKFHVVDKQFFYRKRNYKRAYEIMTLNTIDYENKNLTFCNADCFHG